MKKLGVLTIGQSPRPDMLEDILPILGGNMKIIEAGALDGLSKTEINALAPDAEDRILVTKLADGTVIRVAEEALNARMQAKINQLEGEGADCILILCTARFKGLQSSVPCIEPGGVLNRIIPQMSPNSRIGVLSPEADQIPSTKRDWEGIVDHIEVLTASPYGEEPEIEEAAIQFGQMNIDLVVLDCMGYTEAI